MIEINYYQSFCIVIPAKAEHQVKLFCAIQVDSRIWFFRMPDQVRHDGDDGELETFKLLKTPCVKCV